MWRQFKRDLMPRANAFQTDAWSFVFIWEAYKNYKLNENVLIDACIWWQLSFNIFILIYAKLLFFYLLLLCVSDSWVPHAAFPFIFAHVMNKHFYISTMVNKCALSRLRALLASHILCSYSLLYKYSKISVVLIFISCAKRRLLIFSFRGKFSNDFAFFLHFYLTLSK